ncbi:MAG: Fic family protein [Verrucomicrobia bacterium]|nr:Fic family protein [Verrucomicrobiota bacterium]
MAQLIAKAVHESNWQEGVELSLGRTQELSLEAFDDLDAIKGPHLDMTKLLRIQRDEVVKLKRKKASLEEVAAYNLVFAHMAVKWIAAELNSRLDFARRQIALIIDAASSWRRKAPPRGIPRAIVDLAARLLKEQIDRSTPEQRKAINEVTADLTAAFKDTPDDNDPVERPLTPPIGGRRDLFQALTSVELGELFHPMKIDYLQFLHKVIMMGIIPQSKCGKLRSKSVHVGNHDVLFPIAAALPGLMIEFCKNFPEINGFPSYMRRQWERWGASQPFDAESLDEIVSAAKVSHRFVAIHPFADGNGRVSRLLMNLVLVGHGMPPVYLKANKKGRHRYMQALKRADRGNIEPLASLIAMSLIEIYEMMLESLKAS